MKEHFSTMVINNRKIIHYSSELKSILEHLKNEDKLLGIVYSKDEIKIIVTEDFFELEKYEHLNDNLTIIIDRNLFITCRELYDQRCIKSPKQTYFSALLAYAIFTNAKIDPIIAMYEGGNKIQYKALDDINKFRIINNLSFNSVVQLIFSDSQTIKAKEFKTAIKNTKPLDKITEREDFNKTLNLFRENYPYILKATLLLRTTGVSLLDKIKDFFDWMMTDYITKGDAIHFVLFCFYKSGGIIRDYLTNDYLKLISSIKNATWDVTYVSYLKNQAKKSVNRHFLLATDDKNLLSAAKYYFIPDKKILDELFGNKRQAVHRIINKVNEVCSLPGREKLILERLDNVDKLIISLESEIQKSINSN